MSVVFTNGIFDVIHAGHVRLLKFAKTYGDMLVVAINSDESAKRLKGPTRPIFDQNHRRDILMELRCVDDVVIFSEDTPVNAILRLHPQVLVKGPEAASSYIPGADIVLAYGGKVITPDWPVVESTSLIIQRVLTGTDQPLPLQCRLNIECPDGQGIVNNLEDYSMMFNKQPDGIRPVLYKEGKRVTEPYTISIQYYQPRDKNGCSA